MQIARLETSVIIEKRDRTAEIATSNKGLLKELELLAQREQKWVKSVAENEESDLKVYLVPKSWIKIAPPSK